MQANVPDVISEDGPKSLFYNCGGACIEAMTGGDVPAGTNFKKGTVMMYDEAVSQFIPVQDAAVPYPADAIVGILSQDIVGRAGVVGSGAFVTHNANYDLYSLIFDAGVSVATKRQTIVFMHSNGLKGIPDGLSLNDGQPV